MSEAAVDLNNCDREPIHIPGSIQPHGIMLLADRDTLAVRYAAGEVEGRLGVSRWQGATLGAVIGDTLTGRVARMADSGAITGFVGQFHAPMQIMDVSAHVSGDHVVVELEPTATDSRPATVVLGDLSAAAAAFERASSLQDLCDRAAIEFRRLTGFDRVMIYQFLDDTAGAVLAEAKVAELPSFLHHRFPGTDIPRQARALYVRNRVRVIPDVRYRPVPLRPTWTEPTPLDMSDAILRSVSPIHMQYMQNMGIGATASVSIVKDGVLWGLIACHHRTPRTMPYEVRTACATLAGGLARQIKAKEEAELYRERVRLRGVEDGLIARLSEATDVDGSLIDHLDETARMLGADGVAVVRGDVIDRFGVTPGSIEIRRLINFVLRRGAVAPIATNVLSALHRDAESYSDRASGLLAVVVSADEPFVVMWFRAEQVEVVNWAGNPHKSLDLKPGETLSPRASFEAWAETVRGQALPWSLPEIEAAQRLKQAILDLDARRRLLQLNRTLTEAVAAKDSLLEQKEFLLREVNHRVQNSLSLVSAFLRTQSRSLTDASAREPFEEAQRRVQAVSLVHRRLYRSDQIETVEMGRYLEELVAEMAGSMGEDWAGQIVSDLGPMMMTTDRAVSLGLVLTELLINANKYAYDGAAGPLSISLEPTRTRYRLIVADRGKGRIDNDAGFGSRMMTALVQQLGGEIDYLDNKPGLRAVVSGPI